MLHRLRFVIAGLIIILVNQAVTFAVSAAMPAALLPAGSTRYAVVSTATTASTNSGTFVGVPGMSTKINIPSGKVADVIVVFCGVAYAPTTNLHVRALAAGVEMGPGQVLLRGANSALENQCGLFFLANVGSGLQTVKMQYYSQNTNFVYIYGRSMLVVANIHN